MCKVCPGCGSERIATKNIGRQMCGLIGLVGGGACGAAGAMSGAGSN